MPESDVGMRVPFLVKYIDRCSHFVDATPAQQVGQEGNPQISDPEKLQGLVKCSKLPKSNLTLWGAAAAVIFNCVSTALLEQF